MLCLPPPAGRLAAPRSGWGSLQVWTRRSNPMDTQAPSCGPTQLPSKVRFGRWQWMLFGNQCCWCGFITWQLCTTHNSLVMQLQLTVGHVSWARPPKRVVLLHFWVSWCHYSVISFELHKLSPQTWYHFNPILTGGGGGSIWPPPPPARNPRLPQIATRLFMTFFFQVLHIFWYQVCENRDRRSRGHVTFCTRTSAQNLPEICIFHRFVYKTHENYWFS